MQTQMYGTITPSWQLHIPVEMRKLTGITSHGRVSIKAQKNQIIISKPKGDFMDLAGVFKVKNPIPADKIRDYIDYSR
jgi:bifunctional DNA-binding transcriptional regulator/antitoxin component of YhaV-PrlF toxin-antitoxin module